MAVFSYVLVQCVVGLEVWQEWKQREIRIGQEMRKSLVISFQDLGVRNKGWLGKAERVLSTRGALLVEGPDVLLLARCSGSWHLASDGVVWVTASGSLFRLWDKPELYELGGTGVTRAGSGAGAKSVAMSTVQDLGWVCGNLRPVARSSFSLMLADGGLGQVCPVGE